MWENKMWVTQLGVFEDKTTTAKSILELVPEVLSDDTSSPISKLVASEQLIRVVKKTFIPALDKVLGSNGKVSTRNQVPELKEMLCLAYFDIVQDRKVAKAKTETVMVKKDVDEASSWSSSDEDMSEDGPTAKAPKHQDKDQDVMAKMQDAKDSFLPHELYLYFEYRYNS